jgi:hypothetical protein
MTRRLAVCVFAVLLVASACTKGGSGPSPSATTSSPPASTTVGPTTTPQGGGALPGSTFAFGTLAFIPLLSNQPAYAGPPTPHSLDGVSIVPSLRSELTPAVEEALTTQGFAIVPADYALFSNAYEQAPVEGYPVFVTTDAAYNAWHLAFDKILRSLEQDTLLPKLEQLLSGALAAAREQASELAGTPLAADAEKVVELYQVAGSLLKLDVGTPGPDVAKELALISAHAGPAESPITGATVDYSLFVPRGHYTRNEELTRYFLAMSVLGQSAFCLPGTDACDSVGSLRLGILASRVLTGDPTLAQLWRDIYEPTAFLVGAADDYTPFEVAKAASGFSDPSAFADDAAVEKVGSELQSIRPVMIDPEKPTVRLMGVRFVIDSWVLDQMIYPNVGTESDPRLLPSPLDLAGAFGSDFAYDIQKEAGQTKYANYDEQLKAMRTAIAVRPRQDWGATAYDAWLYAIEPMWLPHGQAFPDFMRTDVWAAKDQQTGFGSYAELKHDTLLYAKQAAAEGETPIPPEQPRNWVEPDPVAFERLEAVVDLTQQGLARRDLLTRESQRILGEVRSLFAFLGKVATGELAGKPISKDANERLKNIGPELSNIWWLTSDQGTSGVATQDKEAAIIADIARGGDQVVEIGTGRIDQIYVLVPDDQDNFQLAVGGVYSYYEFLQPVADRLTDEAWRQMLDQGKAPERPSWEVLTTG